MLQAVDLRALENLVARYAELVDDGDFAAVGDLFADGVFLASGGAFRGREAVEGMLRDRTILYGDGTPRTHHVTTNSVIEQGEGPDEATARSYVTVFQALPGLPLQPVAAGRYRDRFTRAGGVWRFAERRFAIRLVGDTSRHLRP
ncbi:nuclear transport factor 2 family protein [Streptomyces sp. NPDC047002]|uniref:nuclear transport factor 2 family protein n=1 Tax=Streptomyces sp. NPDC047002 TaxID=3155475 RepID=UPI0034511DEF